MADNQETNPFVDLMGAEKQQSTPQIEEIEKISKYAVSPTAENIVNGIAGFMLAIGLIALLVGLLGGMGEFSDGETALGWAFLGGGIVLFLISLVEWAFLKVFVNISRNLYNINDVLHEIKNK